MIIVLVGEKSYTATGIVKEISFAKSNNIPYFGVYVGGANTLTSLPSGLPRNRTIAWNWESIASAVSQMMTEGKNK